ncbi:MAG: glycosyltransferase family 2 protein [Bacteroidetes bacterium]|nr:MAG: glycosyltransferase family 2 protein [Bacteroidota bacterium]
MDTSPKPSAAAPSRRPRLSLCMIVRNEARTLERCLRLARPHVDEIVVIDTGSTDGTQAIARPYADVFEEIEWPNSFAVARNYSFDRASGDFIMVLDGDEYLPEPLHWSRIRAALTRPHLAAILLPIKNLMRSTQIVAADRFWQERIFVNDPSVRYEGRVHNQIREAVVAYARRTGAQILKLDAEVVHTGYALDPGDMKKKYAARIELLRAEFEHPRSPQYQAYYGYQLGLVYFVLERYPEAAAIFNQLDYGQLSPENAFYTRLLATQTALKLEEASMALFHANAMLSIDRTEPIGFFTTGLALLLARQIGDGMLMLLEAYNMNEAHQHAARFALNPEVLLGLLARLCERLNLPRHAAAFHNLKAQPACEARTIKALIASLQTSIVSAELEGARA